MEKYTSPATYRFHPYKPYMFLGILSTILSIIFCIAGVSWLDKIAVNSNAVASFFISCCGAIVSIYMILGYRAHVIITPSSITILNDGNRRYTEKSLDQFSSVYFVRGPQAYQSMVLTNAATDPADIRKIARRNVSGLLLHVKEHIVIPVWPKDIETITTIIGDTIRVVHI